MKHLPAAPFVAALSLIVELASAEAPLVRSAHIRAGDGAADQCAKSVTAGAAKSRLAPMLVKLTPIETDPEHNRLAATLDSASRTAIAGIPGVTVLGEKDDEVAMAKKSTKPVVVLSARLQNIGTSKQGNEVEFRAKIQYVIYRVPGRDIAAVVDGSARTRISAVQVKSKASRQQVEDDVAAAAVESAARRAPAALQAISKR